MTDYLADTYALMRAFEGHPRYAGIFRGSKRVVTTAFNALELYHCLLRDGTSPDAAETFARACLKRVVHIAPDVALAAGPTKLRLNAALRARGEKARISYVDAWGYEAARALGMKFLTGDPVFKGLPDVEFVS